MRVATMGALLLVLSCGGGGEGDVTSFPELEAGCQPLLAGHHCLLPYPSDFYLREDGSLPSGNRVQVTGAATTTTDQGLDAEFSTAYELDGFSRLPLIVGELDDAVVADGFVDILGDFSKTESASSQSLIIDTETGALVPHFTDVDPRAFDPNRRAIALHPVIDLEEIRRYVVVLKGVKNEAGELAASAQGFALLRDVEGQDIEALDEVRAHFEEKIFPVLEEAGVAREEVQLAWDFTTGSDEHATADMLRMRALTLEWLASNEATIVIDSVEADMEGKPDVWRRIQGRITVPLFLESAEPGAVLARDAEGRVRLNGTAEAEFLVSVPTSVRDASVAGRPLFYGHGFFGDRKEIDGDLTRVISSTLGTVMIGIDWWGMSSADLVPLIEDLTGDPVHTARFADRLHQAMGNWIVMTQSLAELASRAELLRPDSGPGSGDGALAGQPVVDADQGISFMGVSQGHILGGTLAAVVPTLDRVILNVGGAGLSHYFFRAEPFGTLLQLISRHFKRPIEQYAWAAGSQRVFDRIDPGLYARHVQREPFEGASPRRVLMQIGVGDVAVPNFGAYFHARSIGLPAVSNEGLALYGIPDMQEAESGFSHYDYDVDTDFYRSPVPPIEGNDVHEAVRVEPAALEQMSRFLEPDGVVEATCEGACDPS